MKIECHDASMDIVAESVQDQFYLFTLLDGMNKDTCNRLTYFISIVEGSEDCDPDGEPMDITEFEKKKEDSGMFAVAKVILSFIDL